MKATENTLPALVASTEDGVTAAEVDLALTSDQKVVLMHDKSLGRTTTCRGPVASRTLRYLKAHCVGKVAGEPVATLTEAVAFLSETAGSRLILELKPHTKWTPDTLKAVTDEVGRRGMTSRTTYHSFSLRLLRMVESVAPEARTHFIVDKYSQVDAAKPVVDGFNLNASDLTVERVRKLRREGFTIFGRVAQRPAVWEKFASAGLDGFLTDAAPQAKEQLNQNRP